MSSISCFHPLALPEELSPLLSRGFSPALAAYRLGGPAGLLRSAPPVHLRGGLLVIEQAAPLPEIDLRSLCRQIMQECRLRGASGVLCRWKNRSPLLWDLSRLLGQTLAQGGFRLWLEEEYAGAWEESAVLVNSRTQSSRLETGLLRSLERWGRDRTALDLRPYARDHLLPSPDGHGRDLSASALEDLIRRARGRVYWSEEQCARYFTLQEGESLHYVVFDDRASLIRKMERAKALGIQMAVVPWQEMAGLEDQWRRLVG